MRRGKKPLVADEHSRAVKYFLRTSEEGSQEGPVADFSRRSADDARLGPKG